MRQRIRTRNGIGRNRRGAVVVLFALLIIPLLGLIAFVVDYGYLVATKVNLQRAADNAALAAVRDLVPDSYGYQDAAAVRQTLRDYVNQNLDDGFIVLDGDIVIGRYDPATAYSNFHIVSSGIYDTVQVTVRYDEQANSPISMFFAKVLGIDSEELAATATAVLQKARYLPEGSDILPVAVPVDVWNDNPLGEVWSIYGDGKIEDYQGHEVPGNWGTIDVGANSNGTSELTDQILNGLRQVDVDVLYENGTIETSEYIDSQYEMWLNGDTGISSGMKSSIIESHGDVKLIPLFDVHNSDVGGNLSYHVVAWGVVRVVDSRWNGNHKSYLEIQKSFLYDGDLRPVDSLADQIDVIENAFTSPVLVR
ncbi:MAG: pilus assembly protein TadG-related protein [Pirellulaceae bacterium]